MSKSASPTFPVLSSIALDDARVDAIGLSMQRDLCAAALEYAPYGICFVNDEFQMLYSNRTLVNWLGQSMQVLLQQTLCQWVYEDDRYIMQRAIKRVLKDGRQYHDVELRLSVPPARPRWVSLSLSKLPHPSQNLVAVHFADVTRRKRTENQLLELANTDHLTGLSNRQVFDDALRRAVKRAKRYNRQGAVLYIDLNDFKNINDTYGHKAGDAALQQIGLTLLDVFRETDTTARIGGDEFAVIMEEVTAKEAQTKAKRMEQAVNNLGLTSDGQPLQVSASVGVHLFKGNGSRVEDILIAADKAMYARKAAHKKSVFN